MTTQPTTQTTLYVRADQPTISPFLMPATRAVGQQNHVAFTRHVMAAWLEPIADKLAKDTLDLVVARMVKFGETIDGKIFPAMVPVTFETDADAIYFIMEWGDRYKIITPGDLA